MARTSKIKRERDRANTKIPNRGTRRKWMTAAILAVGIAAGVAAWQWPGMLWGYKKAPSFALQASTRRTVSLEDFRGKNEVVLVFYMGAG
jgi:ferric-dicitrate binding protein FerR (iron transport regulator)